MNECWWNNVLIKFPQANKEIEFAVEKLKDTNFKYREAREKINTIKKQFETVKQERINRFTYSLEHIATELDSIYKVNKYFYNALDIRRYIYR